MTRIAGTDTDTHMPILYAPFVDDSPKLNMNVRCNLLPVDLGSGNYDVTQEIHGMPSFIRVARVTAHNLPNALANFGKQNPNHGRILSVKRCL